jgi:hypothetical protein
MTLLLLVNIGRREPAEILAPPRRPTPPNADPSPGAGELATECSPHPPAGVAAAELLAASSYEAAAERLPTVTSLFGWLVVDGWCWFVLREEYCWLVTAGCWWLVRSERKVLLAGG